MSGRNTMNRASCSGPNDADTEAEQLARRLQDLQLPAANVTRIMRNILPMQVKINDDTKEAVQRLVNYYIHRITKKANERCHREHRKTVKAEDILWAMNKIGLTKYVDLLTLFLNKCREQDAECSRNTHMPNTVRPNFELALAPHTPSAPSLLINNTPVPSYAHSYFQSTGLFYGPAAAAMINVRNEEMVANDEGLTESSSSTATNFGLLGVKDLYGQFRQ